MAAGGSGRYRSYTGVAYLFVVILISLAGNVVFQACLFPIFPYPMFISLTSGIFPALNAFSAIRKKYDREVWIRHLKIAPLTLLNSLLSGVLFNWSLFLTSMSAVTVITSSSTLFSLLFARILLKTPIKLSTVISIHLSILGSIMVVSASTNSAELLLGEVMLVTDGPDYYRHILGCSLAFMSSICSGLSTVLFTKLQIRNTDAYLTISGCAAMVYTVIFLLFNMEFDIESLVTGQVSQVILIICANGIFSSVLGTYWYIKSLRRLSPVTVNVLWSLSIPLTVMVDYYRGSVHSITPAFLLGALLVLLSTVLVPIEQEETRLADTQLEYDIPLLIIEEDTSPNSARNSSYSSIPLFFTINAT